MQKTWICWTTALWLLFAQQYILYTKKHSHFGNQKKCNKGDTHTVKDLANVGCLLQYSTISVCMFKLQANQTTNNENHEWKPTQKTIFFPLIHRYMAIAKAAANPGPKALPPDEFQSYPSFYSTVRLGLAFSRLKKFSISRNIITFTKRIEHVHHTYGNTISGLSAHCYIKLSFCRRSSILPVRLSTLSVHVHQKSMNSSLKGSTRSPK